jgi:hypothetical protein
MATFRDAAWNLSPARLRTANAARMVYALFAVELDALAEAATQAVLARFPDRCPEDALPYHGRDRGIARGPLEPADSYRGRLLFWIEAWRGAGIGSTLLDQIAGYIQPRTCRMRIITQAGLVYTREANGTFTVSRAAGSWNWDGQTSLWSRFVVVIYPGSDLWQQGPTWGGGGQWATPGRTWGTTATPEDVASVRLLVKDWKPAQSLCESIIIAFDAASFDAAMTSWPDGNWALASKWDAGTQMRVRSRLSTARYWDGVG